MKIAQVVSMEQSVPPMSQNGLEFVVSWLTEALVERGHTVTLFAPEGSKTKARLISLLPQEVWQDGAKEWNHATRSVWNTSLVSSMAHEFDIIHNHTGTMSPLMPFVSTPVVTTLHHRFSDDFWKPYLNTPEHKEQMRFILDQYSKMHYVAVSKKQESDFAIAEDVFFKKHTTIYNGIPVESFDFNPTPDDYLFFIGYINKNKGADVAVQVAKKLGMKLILAGNNFGEEAFFEEHIKPFLDDTIRYVGPVNFAEKVELYKNAYATLAPLNWSEPFGLTLAESQACGTPVVAFNKGAAAEIIKDGTTGFIVDTEDEMIEAVQNVGKLDRAACRAWIEEKFSVRKMVDEYERLYKDIVG